MEVTRAGYARVLGASGGRGPSPRSAWAFSPGWGSCGGRTKEGQRERGGRCSDRRMRSAHPEQSDYSSGLLTPRGWGSKGQQCGWAGPAWPLAPVLWCWSIVALGALCCPQGTGASTEAQALGQPTWGLPSQAQRAPTGLPPSCQAGLAGREGPPSSTASASRVRPLLILLPFAGQVGWPWGRSCPGSWRVVGWGALALLRETGLWLQGERDNSICGL